MKPELKSASLKILLILIILIGLHEYIKIGRSLIDGTYTKEFIRSSPFSKGAGELDSLPPEILDIKKIIQKRNITVFRLEFFEVEKSTEIFFLARALEFLYPTKLDEKSRFMFLIGKQLEHNHCEILDQLNKITLYECTK